MSKSKIIFYKNSARNVTTTHKPYIPQYQVLGVEPEEYKSSKLSSNVAVAAPNSDNPRTKKIGIRQPYAEADYNTIMPNKNIMPNVGNNIEQAWSSIDGDIIDDLEESQLINNDYVSDGSFGVPMVQEQQPYQKRAVPALHSKESPDLYSLVNDLEGGAYLLIVNGVPLCSGPLDEIQDQARALVFGEHELSDGNPIPVEDLIIIKRVPSKMGLFLG